MLILIKLLEKVLNMITLRKVYLRLGISKFLILQILNKE